MNLKHELKKLHAEDLGDRTDPCAQEKMLEIGRKDKIRARFVRTHIEAIKNTSDVESLFYAGIILHHQNSKRSLRLARQIAKIGVSSCESNRSLFCKKIHWLYAGTTDRLLIMENKMQKYGTQYLRNKKTGKYSLQPVDPLTTDEERAAFFVPPLKEAYKLAKKIV